MRPLQHPLPQRRYEAPSTIDGALNIKKVHACFVFSRDVGVHRCEFTTLALAVHSSIWDILFVVLWVWRPDSGPKVAVAHIQMVKKKFQGPILNILI